MRTKKISPLKDVIFQTLSLIPSGPDVAGKIIRERWEEIAGRALAMRSTPLLEGEGTLLILLREEGVEDLFSELLPEIRRRVEGVVGRGVVQRVAIREEFKKGGRKRGRRSPIS